MIFFFNDTATTEIYTLSLHDALPIFPVPVAAGRVRGSGDQGERHRPGGDAEGRPHEPGRLPVVVQPANEEVLRDRKSTRLNSSHANISYAVFCLKKKTSLQTPHNLFV